MGAHSPSGLSDEKASRMMAGLRDGRTLRTLYVRHAQFKTYCEAHPEHAQEALPLIEANAKSARLRKGERLRSKTHCKHGHPLSGANVHYLPNGYRKCLTCQRRREQNPRTPSGEEVQKVTAALNAGKTISQICWGKVGEQKVGGQILPFRNLKRYRELNPDFNKFVISATTNSKSKGQQRRFHPERARVKIIRSETNDFHKIVNMVPVHLPPDVRDDIAQSILVALLEGALQRDHVKVRVQQFVTAHNREANKHGTGKYGLRSIDAAAFVDSSTTFGDTISRGLWD
jgi:hypothetical protein